MFLISWHHVFLTVLLLTAVMLSEFRVLNSVRAMMLLFYLWGGYVTTSWMVIHQPEGWWFDPKHLYVSVSPTQWTPTPHCPQYSHKCRPFITGKIDVLMFWWWDDVCSSMGKTKRFLEMSLNRIGQTSLGFFFVPSTPSLDKHIW